MSLSPPVMRTIVAANVEKQIHCFLALVLVVVRTTAYPKVNDLFPIFVKPFFMTRQAELPDFASQRCQTVVKCALVCVCW